MTNEEINRKVKPGASETPDDDVVLQFDRAKHATSKAVNVLVDGADLWLPYSQIVDWNGEDKECTITSWLASQKGLL